jgi:osmotically-inducible protein OsmY
MISEIELQEKLIMKSQIYVLALALTMASSVAMAQMQPGMGGQQPGGMGQSPPGQHIPGMGEPGMGGTDRMPGEDQQQNTTDTAKQTPTAKVDDDTLMRQVHEQLATKNELNDVKIGVKDGVVTLEGSVPQKQDRKEAKQLAESVPGVRKVKEKLSVRSEGSSAGAGAVGGVSGTGSTNPETRNNNAGSISGNTSAESGTQAGTASMGQAGASSSTAPSINPGTTPGSNAGGTAATSQGESAGTTLPDNASLQEQLQSAFKNDPNLRKSEVATNVTDDTIELTGTVATGKDRQAAKAIAESYAGNRKVVDHLTVK